MKNVLKVGIAGVIVLVGIGGYVLWSGGDGEPSTTITAPPISSEATEAPAGTAPAETVPEQASETTTSVSSGTFEIAPSLSLVTFMLEEDLRGERTVVAGTTSDVVGQIAVDFGTPSASEIGTIIINARTLETGSSFRDRAIRGQILQSAEDEFEFITFEPTAIEGLPDEAADSYSFTVAGDLTIRAITQPVTFEVTIDASSEDSISGTATAQVLRSDFGLQIPSVPSVANVTEEVQLIIEFVAEPA